MENKAKGTITVLANVIGIVGIIVSVINYRDLD